MSEVKRAVTCVALMALLVCSAAMHTPVGAEDTASNPHGDPQGCTVCHVLSREKLERFFTPDAQKRHLRTDPVTLCRQCHGVGFGHGVGKRPEMNRDGLPLAGDGTITCATTCHSMHVKSPADQEQEHYHLRLPLSKICFSCHER